jgi:hypothetical protein
MAEAIEMLMSFMRQQQPGKEANEPCVKFLDHPHELQPYDIDHHAWSVLIVGLAEASVSAFAESSA